MNTPLRNALNVQLASERQKWHALNDILYLLRNSDHNQPYDDAKIKRIVHLRTLLNSVQSSISNLEGLLNSLEE